MRLSYRWVTGDGQVAEVAPGDSVSWPVSLLPTGHSALHIQLDTEVMPVRAEILSYTRVDARTGVPAETVDSMVCQPQVAHGPSCTTHLVGHQVVVDLPVNIGPYLVLYAEWYVPGATSQGSGVSTYYASWGFHF